MKPARLPERVDLHRIEYPGQHRIECLGQRRLERLE